MTLLADPFDGIEFETPAPAVQTPAYPASPAQIRFVHDLLGRKLIPELAAAAKVKVEAMEKREVSKLIDDLKLMPDLPKPGVVTQDGMYRNPATGEIFKVQRAVHGSGNLYAKLLVVDQAWERAEDGTVLVQGEAHFEYAPGAMRELRADWRLTLAEAKEFGALYGSCCRCGKTLTDEKSIEAGIGPVCASKI